MRATYLVSVVGVNREGLEEAKNTVLSPLMLPLYIQHHVIVKSENTKYLDGNYNFREIMFSYEYLEVLRTTDKRTRQ